MNNTELNKTLRDSKVPEPRAGFWEELPSNVQRGVVCRVAHENVRERGVYAEEAEVAGQRFKLVRFLLKRAAPLTLAAACVIMGFLWGAHWRSGSRITQHELAEARAYWREAAALFPDQLQAIVFDQQGSRVVLSEQADQPLFPPVFVKLCQGERCERFITFSGQQIKLNGESFEVLVDRQGEILLVGPAKVWSSAAGTADFGGYKVTAKPLAAT